VNRYLYKKKMALFSDLNEVAYFQIKKDRSILQNKIFELQNLLSELDVAFYHLQCVYEPQINITIEDSIEKSIYKGSVVVVHPDSEKDVTIQFQIGDVNSYKDISDEQLISDSKKLARENIKSKFPIYFI
jgi:hypothetical protein